MNLENKERPYSNNFVDNWYNIYHRHAAARWKKLVFVYANEEYHVPYDFGTETFRELIRLAKRGYDLEQQEKIAS